MNFLVSCKKIRLFALATGLPAGEGFYEGDVATTHDSFISDVYSFFIAPLGAIV